MTFILQILHLLYSQNCVLQIFTEVYNIFSYAKTRLTVIDKILNLAIHLIT